MSKNKDTVLFMAIWEQVGIQVLNPVKFDGIKDETGLKSFFLSARLADEILGCLE